MAHLRYRAVRPGMAHTAADSQSYGIDERLVRTDEVERSAREREQALLTALSGAYNLLYYPSEQEGFAAKAEIKSVFGESGMAIIEQVKKSLEENRKLLMKTSYDTTSVLRGLQGLFFETSDIADLGVFDAVSKRSADGPYSRSRRSLTCSSGAALSMGIGFWPAWIPSCLRKRRKCTNAMCPWLPTLGARMGAGHA